MQAAPSVDAPRNTKVYGSPPAVQPPRPDRDRTNRRRIEARFADAEARLGVKLEPPPDDKTGRKMKHKALAAWKRSPQARTVSAAARELVPELVDTAGWDHKRYGDGLMIAVTYKGQRALAKELGMSVSGIKARMRTLEKAGIIARKKGVPGRNSITVVELRTAPPPLKSQDLPRGTHPCPTVGHTPVPQRDTPLSESSSSVTSHSEKSPSGNCDSESSLSGVHDAAAGGKEGTTEAPATPPRQFNRRALREALMELGVNRQTLPTLEKKHPEEVLAAVVYAINGFKKARPNAKILKSERSTGAWIGSILLQDKPFAAYVRDELLTLDDPRGRIAWAVDVLEMCGMIADTEYADR